MAQRRTQTPLLPRQSFYQRSESMCSLAPTPLRQTSANRLAAPGAPRQTAKDPRPLQDKQWRHQQAKKVLAFLEKHGFERRIQLQDLSHCPTTGDVDAIFRFLFALYPLPTRFEQHQALDGEKLHLVVKKLLKYPYQLPATMKQVHVSPMTWSNLFGITLWLVERLESCVDHEAAKKIDPESAEVLAHPTRLAALALQCNEDRIAGKENWSKRLELLLCQAEVARDAAVRDKEQAVHILERLRRDVQDLRSQPDELSELLRQRALAEDQVHRLVMYLETMRKHVGDLAAAERDQLSAKAQRESEIADLKARKQQLQSGVASQKLTREDEERILRETRSLMGQLSQWEATVRDRERQLQQVEEAVQHKLTELAASCSAYNQVAQALHMAPAGAKHSGGKDLTARVVDVRAVIPGQDGTVPLVEAPKVVALDFKNDVQPILERLHQHHADKVNATQVQLEHYGRQCTQLSQTLDSEKRDLQQVTAELRVAEETARELEQQVRAQRHLDDEVRQREEAFVLEKHKLAEAIGAALHEATTYRDRISQYLGEYEAQAALLLRGI